MKIFAILAIISVCVAFTAALMCPDPPLNPKFGHGPACTPRPATTAVEPPCCPKKPILFGIGPVCTDCSKKGTAAPAVN